MDKRNQVARLPDLVEFLDREVRYMLEPHYRIIEDHKTIATNKGSTFTKTEERSEPKRRRFAITTIPVETTDGMKGNACYVMKLVTP